MPSDITPGSFFSSGSMYFQFGILETSSGWNTPSRTSSAAFSSTQVLITSGDTEPVRSLVRALVLLEKACVCRSTFGYWALKLFT